MVAHWFRTKSDLFAAMPFACREDALLVAEDTVNPNKCEVVKRYAAAATAEEYLSLLGVPAGAGEAAPRGPRHRYEIVQSLQTPVFAFFDVDSATPPASEAKPASEATRRHRAVEAQVRCDLERHFGLEPGSQLVALSSSHSPSKSSVHAVVRYETTMQDLTLDLAEIRSASPLGAAYDNIYNRFRCFRAVGSSKHPGAGRGAAIGAAIGAAKGASGAPKPVLEPCECGPRDPAAHVVRPLRSASGPSGPPSSSVLAELPPDCPAARVRRQSSEDREGSPGRKRRWAGDLDADGGSVPDRAGAEKVNALVYAAMRSGLARDIGVDSPVQFCFDKVTATKAETRAELSKRSFFCPGKGGYHSSNRALLVLTEASDERGPARIKFVCLDAACRSANRSSVLCRAIEAAT